MVYECECCGYVTIRKANFLRHKNRKNTCDKTKTRVCTKGVTRSVDIEQNRYAVEQNRYAVEQNRYAVEQNRYADNYKDINTLFACIKCNKQLCNKQKLAYHIEICKGVGSKTCPTCFKVFGSVQGRYQHVNHVKCSPPPPQPSIKNNRTYIENQTNNNVTNNVSNCNNQNIMINVFGSEDLSYLSNDSNIIHRLRMYGKEGIYGLPKIIDDVHFNKERPENQTIIKPEEYAKHAHRILRCEYGNTVLIKNDNNEWELREFEDVRDNMIDTIIKYFKAYNDVKKKLNIKLLEKKERQFIKTISYELMALDGSLPNDLFNELDMDEDNVVDDETEKKNKTRKFDKCTMHTIHNRTSSCYKRDNGFYIKK